MTMPVGPLKYTSPHEGLPLGEDEEALLAFAACGVTGYALSDLAYASGYGGTMMVGFLGRTVPSGDAIHGAGLIVMNPEATYYLKRPQDFDPAEYPEVAKLAERGEYTELYRRSRVKIRDGRTAPPTATPFNLNINKWSLYDPAATYFLPVSEVTLMYINALLEAFNESTAYCIVDERAGFRPAGIKQFCRSKGGHLCDDPREKHIATVQQFEGICAQFVLVEQAFMIQNLSLMTTAMGLGGFPHWAAHPFGWFDALGFRTVKTTASRYLGMGWLRRKMASLLKLDTPVSFPVGLEREGVPLIMPFCPPYYPTMEAAVRAVVDMKFGKQGSFRGSAGRSAWNDPAAVAAAAPAHSEANIAAVIAYCEYIYGRYGRFPAYYAPMHTGLGFQSNHIDLEFYAKHYRPEAVSETHRNHAKAWHAG
jgi:hypothetical protein